MKDPPTDLEEVVGGTYVPRVDPKTQREISGRFFQFAVPYLLVSYVPDGDYSDRTNPHRPVFHP